MCRVSQRSLVAGLVRRDLTDRDQRFRIAVHLSSGCTDCWANVDAVPAPARPGASLDPMTRALRRIRNRRSWSRLSARHLRVAQDVRHTEWGFVYLMIEEARTLLLRGGLTGRDFLRFLVEAGLLVETLERKEPSLTAEDLKAHLALACVLFYSLHHGVEPDRAEAALRSAERFANRGTGSPALQLDLARHAGLLTERNSRVLS